MNKFTKVTQCGLKINLDSTIMSFIFNLTFFNKVPSNSVNFEIYMLLMQIFSFIKKKFKLYVIHITNDFYKFTA